jgi:hypothetical protein
MRNFSGRNEDELNRRERGPEYVFNLSIPQQISSQIAERRAVIGVAAML